MDSTISKMKYVLLALFAVASLATVGYEWWFVWPAKDCDAKQQWWDPKDHQCLSPMPIWRITGHELPKPPPSSGPGGKP